jgi:hypothetical protein
MSEETRRPTIPARELPSGKYKRAHARYELRMPVSAEILIPEDTFRPHGLSGYTQDVSLQGMQIVLDALRVDLYTRLLSRPRHVRITFRSPVSGEQIKMTGRIAWIDYRKPKASDAEGACHLGVIFSERDDGVDLRPYASFLDGLDVQ